MHLQSSSVNPKMSKTMSSLASLSNSSETHTLVPLSIPTTSILLHPSSSMQKPSMTSRPVNQKLSVLFLPTPNVLLEGLESVLFKQGQRTCIQKCGHCRESGHSARTCKERFDVGWLSNVIMRILNLWLLRYQLLRVLSPQQEKKRMEHIDFWSVMVLHIVWTIKSY